jgi:hypothetical protein
MGSRWRPAQWNGPPVAFAAFLFPASFAAFFLWKRIAHAPRAPLPPQSIGNYIVRIHAGALTFALMGFTAYALAFLLSFATTAWTAAALIGSWTLALAFLAAPYVRDLRVLLLAAAVGPCLRRSRWAASGFNILGSDRRAARMIGRGTIRPSWRLRSDR